MQEVAIQLLRQIIAEAIQDTNKPLNGEIAKTLFGPEDIVELLQSIAGRPQPLGPSGSSIVVGNIERASTLAIGPGALAVAFTIQVVDGGKLEPEPLQSHTFDKVQQLSLKKQLQDLRRKLTNTKESLANNSVINKNTTERIISLHSSIEHTKGLLKHNQQIDEDEDDDEPAATVRAIVAISRTLLNKDAPRDDERHLAWQRYQQAVTIAKRTSVRITESAIVPQIYLELAISTFDAGDLRRSQRALTEGLRFVGSGSSQQRFDLMLEQLRIYIDQGYRDAVAFAKKTYELGISLSTQGTQWGRLLLYFALALRDAGQRDAYLIYLNKAIDTFGEAGDDTYSFLSLINRASELTAWGDSDRAIPVFLDLLNRSPSHKATADLVQNLATAYTDNGDLDKAEHYARRSIDEYRHPRVADKRGELTARLSLGEILKDKTIKLESSDARKVELFSTAEGFLQETMQLITGEYGTFQDSVLESIRVEATDEGVHAKEQLAELHRILAELYLSKTTNDLQALYESDIELNEAERLSIGIDINIAARVKVARTRYDYLQQSYLTALAKLDAAEQDFMQSGQQREIVPLKLLRVQILKDMGQSNSACQELKVIRRLIQQGVSRKYKNKLELLIQEIGCTAM